MKKTVMWLSVTILLFLASGATPAKADGGGEPPLCYPKPCPGR